MKAKQEKILLKDKIANKLSNIIKNVKGGYLGRERFLFTYFIYHFLHYFGYDFQKLNEWRFILKNLVKDKNKKTKILDSGCCASLFIYELSRYGEAYGIDSRPYSERLPKTIRFVVCDITKLPFPDSYFDYIILISVIEHIGYGAYGDPIYPNSDFKTMVEVKRVLRNQGEIFITTNISNEDSKATDNIERIYDEKRLNALIEGFSIVAEEYYIFQNKWVVATKKDAFAQLPQRPGLVCLRLKNINDKIY